MYRFDVGGLENGVVNLVNGMPADRYRHVIIALTDCDAGFARRIRRDDVQLVSLNKPPGQGAKLFPAFYRLMRDLRPDILHTRNSAALEMTVPAALARVPVRIHGEHGWDASDPNGSRARFRWLRRGFAPFVHHYVALSGEIEGYLVNRVGVAARRVTRICNGVDTRRFAPRDVRPRPAGMPPIPADAKVFGTVGRLDEVKDQVSLVRAFGRFCAGDPVAAGKARLVIAGDGPWRARVEAAIRETGQGERIWLPGARSDVPDILAALDVFILPSLGEGISNTILEAMATGLPVVATRVGGNPELVVDGETGWLVPPADPVTLADSMARIFAAPQQRRQFGTAGRRRIEAQFSLDAMVGQYGHLYDSLLGRDPRAT